MTPYDYRDGPCTHTKAKGPCGKLVYVTALSHSQRHSTHNRHMWFTADLKLCPGQATQKAPLNQLW